MTKYKLSTLYPNSYEVKGTHFKVVKSPGVPGQWYIIHRHQFSYLTCDLTLETTWHVSQLTKSEWLKRVYFKNELEALGVIQLYMDNVSHED